MEWKYLKIPDGYDILNPGLYDEIDDCISSGRGFRFYFVGPPGNGKTDLAWAVYQALRRKVAEDGSAKWPEWYVARELWNDYYQVLLSNYDDKAEGMRRRKYILNHDRMFIDELGDEQKETGYRKSANSHVCELIENYYDYFKSMKRSGKENTVCSIMTSNMDGNETIKAYGLRVLDRIYEMYQVVEFTNPSYRAKQFKKKLECKQGW